MAKVAYQEMLCKDLLELAPTKPGAYRALLSRASNWQTCALGDVARALHVDPYVVMDMDRKGIVEDLGVDFMDQVKDKRYTQAKNTMKKLKTRIKAVLATVIEGA